MRHLLILKEVILNLDDLKQREEGLGTAEKAKDKRGLPTSARTTEFGGLGTVTGTLGGGVTGMC